MKLIYGTHNSAKLEVMRQYVRTLDIDIAGFPADMDVPPVPACFLMACPPANSRGRMCDVLRGTA